MNNCIICKHHRVKHHPHHWYCREKGCDCPRFVEKEDVLMRGVGKKTGGWIKEHLKNRKGGIK